MLVSEMFAGPLLTMMDLCRGGPGVMVCTDVWNDVRCGAIIIFTKSNIPHQLNSLLQDIVDTVLVSATMVVP